jgi:amino acid adenylation domain-containing protein/thioester reductase-like protein
MSNFQHHTLIHQFIEHQAEQTPDAIAVTFQDRQLTYQQLNCKANQIARYLQTLGVQPETLVGICIDRSLDLVIALLGILKAGGAYVPLDPSYPSERIAFMIEDSQLPILLAQTHLNEDIPQHRGLTIFIDAIWDKIAQYPIDNVSSSVQPHNLAYAIYTSGSTGKPKGVLIEHQGAVNTILDINQRFRVGPQDRVLAICSLNFDLSVYDIFGLLAAGGTIVLPEPASVPDLAHWVDLMNRERITLWNSAPPVMQMLTGHLEKSDYSLPDSLRLVLLSGDWIPLALPSLIRQSIAGEEKPVEIISLGGATEASIWSIFYSISQIEPTWKSIPYGRPLTNQSFHILDDQLKTVPEGTVGELYIGGLGVARGYLNRPDLNATKFIYDPVGQSANGRLYRTGDLGRYLSDGNIEFLGRIDHQVKIRGFRVELGEIEALLAEHSNVNQVIVVTREDISGNKQIVAYVVVAAKLQLQNPQVATKTLKNYLKQKLPEYMVPAAIVALETFPLTPNGKIDRRALPVPKWGGEEEGNYVAPSTSTEIRLAKIWTQFLGVEPISIHDTFLSLGGHSLLAVQLIYQTNEAFLVEMSLSYFLDNPTIFGLAKAIDALHGGKITSESIEDPNNDAVLDSSIYPENILDEPIPEIFLTGSTGFLGTFLLFELLQQTRADIHCLIRADSLAEAQARIQSSLKRYTLWDDSFGNRIKLVLGDLTQPYMGIESEQFSRLAEKIDIIYHCGAWVNVVYPYSALKAANVIGTQEVLRLACLTRIKPLHFISTIDVFATLEGNRIKAVGESSETGPFNALYNGYAQSKYIAEQLVISAASRGLPVSIYRPSNVLGHSKTGFCQLSDFIVKMIKGCIQMEAAPRIDALLNLVPVDYVCQSIVHLSQHQKPNGQVFHVVSRNSIQWEQLVNWIANLGSTVKLISYEEWYAKLLKLTANSFQPSCNEPSVNELVPLTPLFANQAFIHKSLGAFQLDDANTMAGLANSSINCPQFNEALLNTYIAYFVENGFIKLPQSKRTSEELSVQERSAAESSFSALSHL